MGNAVQKGLFGSVCGVQGTDAPPYRLYSQLIYGTANTGIGYPKGGPVQYAIQSGKLLYGFPGPLQFLHYFFGRKESKSLGVGIGMVAKNMSFGNYFLNHIRMLRYLLTDTKKSGLGIISV